MILLADYIFVYARLVTADSLNKKYIAQISKLMLSLESYLLERRAIRRVTTRGMSIAPA